MNNGISELVDKIKECMVYNSKLGGRCTFEVDLEDAEEIMYLATGEHYNSQCPEIRTIITVGSKSEEKIFCGKSVSCVCTSTCSHIWYCPDHVLNHEHRKTLHSEDSP